HEAVASCWLPVARRLPAAHWQLATHSSIHLNHPPLEQLDGELDPAVFDAFGASRPNAGGVELSDRVTVEVDAGLLEDEEVVHLELIAFHAGEFADADDLSLAARQATGLHDNLQRAGHLLAQRPQGNVVTGHRDHHFQATQGVARGV